MKGLDLLIVLLFLLPVACFTPKSTVKPSVINLSKMYNPANTRFHPAYTIYHNSPTSLLLIKIFPLNCCIPEPLNQTKCWARLA